MSARIVQDASLTLLGLFTGAMFFIGIVLVGYWQSLEPDAFSSWFVANAPRIGGVMIPLGVAATLVTVGSAAVTWRAGGAGRGWSVASAVFAVLILVVYFTVHAPRNAAFETRSIAPERIAGELVIWARWHWVRVLLGLAAFWAQLLAVRSTRH